MFDDSGEDALGEKVGYKKPPRHSQFKKGRSGNPKGRPRFAVTMRENFLRVAFKSVSVKDSKGSQEKSLLEHWMASEIVHATRSPAHLKLLERHRESLTPPRSRLSRDGVIEKTASGANLVFVITDEELAGIERLREELGSYLTSA